jgi:hypothetical protein
MKRKLSALFLTLLVFSCTASAQTTATDVIVPEKTMKQVIRNLLILYIKPSKQKKVVYLAQNGLQKSWLPEIKGIEFRLLSGYEEEKRFSHYRFYLPEGEYEIAFGYGDWGSGFEGDVWSFRLLRQNVQLKKNKNLRWMSSGQDSSSPLK